MGARLFGAPPPRKYVDRGLLARPPRGTTAQVPQLSPDPAPKQTPYPCRKGRRTRQGSSLRRGTRASVAPLSRSRRRSPRGSRPCAGDRRRREPRTGCRCASNRLHPPATLDRRLVQMQNSIAEDQRACGPPSNLLGDLRRRERRDRHSTGMRRLRGADDEMATDSHRVLDDRHTAPPSSAAEFRPHHPPADHGVARPHRHRGDGRATVRGPRSSSSAGRSRCSAREGAGRIGVLPTDKRSP